MFDVGFAELFLLAIIGLLVLGPERLPAVARTLGGFLRKARASWYTLKTSIESELAAADVREPLKAAKSEFEEVTRKIGEQAREGIVTDKADDSGKPAPVDAEDKAEDGDHPRESSRPEPDRDDDPRSAA